MSTEAIDAQFVERSSALAVRSAAAPAVSWTPSFAVAVDDAIERKRQKRRFFEEVMEPGLHYGVIPGTGEKPTLLKPGAEMLLSNMGLNATFVDAEPPVIDVLGSEHGGEAFIRYRRICRIYRQLGPSEAERMIVAEAAGSCSSWETKYRYRSSGAACPTCNKSLRMSKDKPEWYCWTKKGGCGATYPKAQFSFEQVPNPDVAELENTILKMADKRALVAATLIATGCSDIFTQDAEDSGSEPTRDPVPDPAPVVKRSASDPGSIKEAAIVKLTQEAFSPLNLTGPEIGALFSLVTNGRVTDADAIKDLAQNEAVTLWKQLAETVCPACERKPLVDKPPHVKGCPEDHSGARDPREPFLEEELPL